MKSGSHLAADGSLDVLRSEVTSPADLSAAARDTHASVTAPQAASPAVSHAVTPAVTRTLAYSPRAGGYRLALVVLDTLAAFVAGLLVLIGSDPVRLVDFVLCCTLVVVWALAVAGNGGYERGVVGAGNREFSRIFRAFLQITAVTVFALFLLDLRPSRSVVVPSLALLLVLTCAARYFARKVLHLRRRHGRSLTPVLAVGDPDAVVAFAALLRRDRFAGMDVAGACYTRPPAPGTATAAELRDLGIRDFGELTAIADAARAFEAPTVAVLDGSVGAERLRRIGWELEGAGADLVVSPGLAEFGGRRMHIRPVAGLPLLAIDEPRFTGGSRVVKGAFDFLTAAVAVVVLSPVLLLIGALVRATSSGPALYRQTRIGRNGREFTMLKFRSMTVGADRLVNELAGESDGNEVLFKLRHDPRVTRFGRVLRRVSLDELPQLFNVVSGSMSLVGPRPPLPTEVAQYHDDAHRRLLVKPGLTGLWQISGRSDLSWEDSIRLDLRYVEDWSLSLDLIVLWKTARAVIKAEGAY